MSNSVTLWTATHRAHLSSTISQNLFTLMSILLVTISSHFILYYPSSFHLPSFPESGSFPMSWLLMSSGQSTGTSASASVLSMNIQCWFPLGLTGLISLLSKRLSGVFPSTTIWKVNSSMLSLLSDPISHLYMTTGKTIALSIRIFAGKVMSVF